MKILIKSPKNLSKIHFILLSFIVLNFVFQLASNFSLNNKIIFSLKIILYLSGLILFLLNCKPLKNSAIYLSYYLITPLVVFLFWLFNGIFFGLLSSFLLYPLYPKNLISVEGNLKVYEKYQGFIAACCTYEIVENKFFIIEKYYGELKIEGPYDEKHSEIRIVNDSIIYQKAM